MDSKKEKTVVELSKEAVDGLYHYRDHYFETNGIEKAFQKKEDVIGKMNATFELVNSLKDQIENKAVFFMMLGQILNVKSEYDNKAEEYLGKAVKLDPSLVVAWNHLGELFWKKGEIDNAKNCFTGALAHSKNKVSLRNYSMVLRQLNDVPEQKVKNVEESVEKAKEAVQLDIQDGQSWLILGNAYMSSFFSSGQNPKVVYQALSAYKQAEKDPVAKNSVDLHFNRASAYRFVEDFQSALEGFSRASQLDPRWNEPEIQENTLLNYLSGVTEMIEAKGKVKGKRLQTLSRSPRDNALGPYAGGSCTNSKGETVKLMRCSFKDLEVGKNEEKVILGNVVCTVPNESVVPFTFCMLDEDGTCLPVNVYNIAKGTGVKIGDSVAIPEPYIQHVDVNHKGKLFSFDSVRVQTPVVLVVNGRKMAREKQVGTVLVVNAWSD